jgi:hypothetical protein
MNGSDNMDRKNSICDYENYKKEIELNFIHD